MNEPKRASEAAGNAENIALNFIESLADKNLTTPEAIGIVSVIAASVFELWCQRINSQDYLRFLARGFAAYRIEIARRETTRNS